MKMDMKRALLYLLLLAVALSAGSCRRAVERVGRKIRFEAVERIERQGLTGAEVVVRIDNGSGYNLTLSSAEIGIHYGASCVGTLVLSQPVEVPRRSVASVVTRWRIRISDPLALYLLARKVKDGELARIAHMSPRSFHRHFKKNVGSSPVDYLMRIRIQHASDLLINSNSSIGEIAARCGFYDSNYFCKQFREIQATTPRAFRLAYRKIISAQMHSKGILHP